MVSCTGGERGSHPQPGARGRRRRSSPTSRGSGAPRWSWPGRSSACDHQWLGFVDSGLPEGDPLPPLPEGCFALQPLEEATEPLVRVVRAFRPHVIITYDENGGYPHPDHIKTHEVSVEAFDAAGDPERYPGTGEPWQPLKLYYHLTFHKARLVALHEAARRRRARVAVRGVARRLGGQARRTPSG